MGLDMVSVGLHADNAVSDIQFRLLVVCKSVAGVGAIGAGANVVGANVTGVNLPRVNLHRVDLREPEAVDVGEVVAGSPWSLTLNKRLSPEVTQTGARGRQ